MLNENSGSPPPMISSRPRTPVGSWRILTFPCRLAFFAAVRRLLLGSLIALAFSKIEVVHIRPDIVHQLQR
jgi:hypothetical protein